MRWPWRRRRSLAAGLVVYRPKVVFVEPLARCGWRIRWHDSKGVEAVFFESTRDRAVKLAREALGETAYGEAERGNVEERS